MIGTKVRDAATDAASLPFVGPMAQTVKALRDRVSSRRLSAIAIVRRVFSHPTPMPTGTDGPESDRLPCAAANAWLGSRMERQAGWAWLPSRCTDDTRAALHWLQAQSRPSPHDRVAVSLGDHHDENANERRASNT